MGLFGPFVYKSKNGQKFWLHSREKGKQKLFYFSREREGALNYLPKGFKVIENTETGMPMLKKRKGGFFDIIKTIKPEKKIEVEE
jgi:hypothetical protein